jgi:hypothetical protein
METRKLDNWEIENIEGLIPEIEEMFQIKFHSEELINVSSVDELCNVIIDKIPLTNVDSCTKQQAFYRLRVTFDKLGIIDRNSLTLKNKLDELMPRKNRKQLAIRIENELGFKINLIEPPRLLTKILIYGIFISFILLFIKWQIGLVGIIVFILSLMINNKLGNELRVKSVRELIELITRENYLKVRSDNGTINRKELKNVILDWFSDNLEMDKKDLVNARFV